MCWERMGDAEDQGQVFGQEGGCREKINKKVGAQSPAFRCEFHMHTSMLS